MKKTALTVFTCIIVLFVSGQELAIVVEESSSRPGVKEEFSVLRSKKKIKHGPYKRTNAQGKITVTGFYKENKKDSIWEEYNYNGAKLLSRGHYLNDEKTGVWEYYGYDAFEEQQYDYSTNQLVSFKSNPKDSIYLMYNGSEMVRTRLDQPPLLIGGSQVVQQTLIRNLRYPADAIKNNKSGIVIIGFDIDVDGSPGNYTVVESVYRSLDQEAVRVIKMIPKQWIPAIKDGQKVKVQMKQPVVFRME